MSLNSDQSAAVDSMVEFLKPSNKAHFFVLKGFAGTGKTYCIQTLKDRVRGRLIYTAPTNKATRVLRETITSQDYRPQCKTIYSLLGLRLEASGEIRELTKPDEDIDLSQFLCVIVDEGSMLNSIVLSYMLRTAEEQGIKFIIMGDAAQINPVKEDISPVWKLDCPKAELTKVMRYDNQILALATSLRMQVGHPSPKFSPKTDNDGKEGIWMPAINNDFVNMILEDARLGLFQEKDMTKVVAWRNATTENYNKLIRSEIFAEAADQPWLIGDRVICTAPAKNLEGDPIASTDDEGLVTRVWEEPHPNHADFNVYGLAVTTDDNRVITLRVLHPSSQHDFDVECERKAAAARTQPRKWRDFWEFKEDFHQIRHAYAITSHRSQGSTYVTTYVDWRDILVNRNRTEAFRCLYVACTRAKKRLILGA